MTRDFIYEAPEALAHSRTHESLRSAD